MEFKEDKKNGNENRSSITLKTTYLILSYLTIWPSFYQYNMFQWFLFLNGTSFLSFNNNFMLISQFLALN